MNERASTDGLGPGGCAFCTLLELPIQRPTRDLDVPPSVSRDDVLLGILHPSRKFWRIRNVDVRAPYVRVLPAWDPRGNASATTGWEATPQRATRAGSTSLGSSPR